MFRDERITGAIPAGWSVDEIIGQMVVEHAIHPGIIPALRVSIWSEKTKRETFVPYDDWRKVRPKPGCSVRVHAVPMGGGGGGGGKSPLKMIAMLAVMVVAAWAGGVMAPFIGQFMAANFGVGLTMGMATAIGSGIVTLVGNALINAIIPASTNADRSSDALNSSYNTSLSTPTYSIMGVRNRANPFGVVPKVYGRRRVFPMLAANTYTETQGSDQYFRALFCFGYGPLQIEDIKIGETSIDDFIGVEYELREGYSTDTPVTLFTRSVGEDSLNIHLTQAGSWATRTTRANTDEITVDVNLPRGLTIFNSSGGRSERSVSLSVEYSVTGAASWVSAGTISLTDNSTSAVRGTLRWTVTKGQYDVRIKRDTADSSSDQIMDSTYWSTLRSITTEYPINMPGLALLAVRIKATEQLNGAIETLNAVCTSVLPAWNGTSWSAPAVTRNPAWAWCDVLRGSANNRPTDDDDIDLASILDWANACDATSPQGEGPTWQYDAVHDKATTVDQMLRDIAAAGRARYIRRDGKESILRDVAQTTAFQHFTPRNSWGFKSTKSFVDHPHGLKCRFVNPDEGWQEDEVVVYADGYTSTTASLFEQIDMLSCINQKQAWREGRYHMYAARLRPATYEINTDVENFACQPGDLVYVAYDVPMWGQWQSRIQEMTFDGGGQATTITLDSTVTMEAGKTYVVRIRRTADNSTLLQAVNTVVGEQSVLTFTTPVVVTDVPDIDDLVMFGETNEESVRLIVKSINRGQDLSARIVMVDEAPAVHTSYTGSIPTFVSNISQIAPVERQQPPTPTIIEVWDDEVLVRGNVVSRTYVALSVPASATIAATGVEVQYKPVAGSSWTVAQGAVLGQDVVIDGLESDQQYNIRARSVSQYGVTSEWATTTFTSLGLAAPPEDVTDFNISVLDTTAYLSWSPVADVDLSHYVIKWSPDTAGVTWGNSQILVPRVDGTSVTVPALAGTYLIKAVDFSASESVNPSLIINGVQGILNMNAVATITEDPAFSGVKTDTVVRTAALELDTLLNVDDIPDIDLVTDFDLFGDDFVSEGIYYFASDLDLGDVFTSRLTASLDVTGVNYVNVVDRDLGVDSWADIDTVPDWDTYAATAGGWSNVDNILDWDGSDPSGWSVEIQVRTSQDYVTWGAWQTFVIGDYSARAFQWRVILRHTAQGVTPSITGLTVTVDMPDRLASDNDVLCTVAGLTVTFSPAFMVAPAIAVADQNMATGDYKTITGISSTGFTIQYFNSSNAAVQRTFDWVARGYGYVA
jgi:hypothetical protein